MDTEKQGCEADADDAELDDLLRRKDESRQRNSAKARGRLIRWLIRTALGAVIFGYLASRYDWGKYILYVWVPLAVLSLISITIRSASIERLCQKLENEAPALRERNED